MPIKVLVVDDSATVRKALSEQLSQFADVQVVGTAVDAYVARDKIAALEPDVITLDVDMPRMDGLTFLEKLMEHHPIPVVIVSSIATDGSEAALRALELGAVDIVPKPGSGFTVPDVSRDLIRAVRGAAATRVRRPPQIGPVGTAVAMDGEVADGRLIAIGASTGGTRAIEAVLASFPADAPPTLMVQHMPPRFTTAFAQRLDRLARVSVREARDGDQPARGQALLAPGGKHMLVRKVGERLVVRLKDGPPVHYQRPSVDVLFDSVADNVGADAVGVLLTGMGADGARGLLAMRRRGAYTIAESEETATVFGMPREAIMLGAAAEVAPLPRVAESVMRALARRDGPDDDEQTGS